MKTLRFVDDGPWTYTSKWGAQPNTRTEAASRQLTVRLSSVCPVKHSFGSKTSSFAGVLRSHWDRLSWSLPSHGPFWTFFWGSESSNMMASRLQHRRAGPLLGSWFSHSMGTHMRYEHMSCICFVIIPAICANQKLIGLQFPKLTKHLFPP